MFTHFRPRRLGQLTAASLIALGLGGCGSDTATAPVGISPASAAAVTSSPPTSAAPDPDPGPSERSERQPRRHSSSSATPDTARAAADVAAVSLRTGDPGVAGTVQLYPDGDRVAGHATFDLCGARFTTERDRVARRLVAVVGADSVHFTNEVVAYTDADAANLALHEFAAATKVCDPHVVLPPSAPGRPFAAYAVSRVAANLTQLPVRPNIVAEIDTLPATGATTYSVVTYQQHGSLVDATTYTGTTRATPAQLATLTRLAGATGSRMAALPD